jgi:hypothetical protein
LRNYYHKNIAHSCAITVNSLPGNDLGSVMLSFRPSLKLEKALKQLQIQVANVATGLRSLSAAEALYLNRCALISNVSASTRIENALLTDAEVE